MTMHTDKTFTPFRALLTDFVRNKEPRPGNTAKEAERNVAVHAAQHEDIAQFLAHLGTAERAAALRSLFELLPGQGHQWVPMLDRYVVQQWLRTVRSRWDEGQWKSVEDDEFFDQLDGEFQKLVFDESTQKLVHSYRKDCILSGRLDPAPEDEDWLRAEYEVMAANVNPYQAALDKLKG